MRKLKIFWQNHWLKIVIGGSMVLLVFLTFLGLMSLESFYRNLTLATIPLQLLLAMLNAFIFVYLYMTLMQGGFGKLRKNIQIKAEDVNINFKDVIGLENA